MGKLVWLLFAQVQFYPKNTTSFPYHGFQKPCIFVLELSGRTLLFTNDEPTPRHSFTIRRTHEEH
jgi:hypothetical protein